MEKIFCIGMFKTGTTSMGRAFEILGYKTMNGPWGPKGYMIRDDFYERPQEWIPYYKNIKIMVERYDAFQNYPWMFLYDKLDEWYPNAKFVLTIRNVEDLAVSDINMLIKLGHSEDKIRNDKDKISILGAAKKVIEVSGKNIEPSLIPFEIADRSTDREISKRIPDISKARKVLGYEPKVFLEEGIKKVMSSGEIASSWIEPMEN